jgi:hypothetical protein
MCSVIIIITKTPRSPSKPGINPSRGALETKAVSVTAFRLPCACGHPRPLDRR